MADNFAFALFSNRDVVRCVEVADNSLDVFLEELNIEVVNAADTQDFFVGDVGSVDVVEEFFLEVILADEKNCAQEYEDGQRVVYIDMSVSGSTYNHQCYPYSHIF